MQDDAWPRCCLALLVGSVTAAARQFPGRGEHAPERGGPYRGDTPLCPLC